MSSQLPTINLQGKQYVQVKDRIKYFRENFKDFAIVTTPTVGNESVMFKAEIINAEGRTVATAHSMGKFSRDKALEKQESVAVGRALAMFGIGIDDSVASADEIVEYIKDTNPNNGDKDEPKKVTPPVRAEKSPPTVSTVMETMNNCNNQKSLDIVYGQATKYEWSPEDKKSLEECYNNLTVKFTF